MKTDNQLSFGMIGLGTMGRNLLLNMADHGYSVSGYDKDKTKVALLENERTTEATKGFSDIKEFIQSLKSPRTLMLLVPAGKIVDDVIAELTPLISKGDILIDGGNSHFTDTDRRCKDLENSGFRFIGMGVSGGEEGARFGPSMMPGGDKEAYEHLRQLFEAISAKVNNEPCVTYIGPGGAGHFVKMVHNGIEYALMQLIAETYDLLQKEVKLDNNAIHAIFKQWNEGRLQSFLMEITADIFAFKLDGDSTYLVDEIKDEAKAKGTGKWTSQIAMDLQVPVPVIDTAVAIRDLSKLKSLREQIASMMDEPSPASITQNKDEFLVNLEQAFFFSMVITYSQGMHLLYKASQEFNYNLALDKVAKIWRGGCIIRSAFLENMYQAFHHKADLEHILTDATILAQIKESLPGIRAIVSNAARHGIGIPAFASTLSYFDCLKSEKMPSNLIQAQRDYFGAHTYERIGKEGIFHTEWTVSTKK